MALDHVRAGDFRNGTLVTIPKNFGNPVKLSPVPVQDFGNTIPSNQSNVNTITQLPSPKNFGNRIGGTPIVPTFSPVAGAYHPSLLVLIISVGADAIYFTIDGSTPTTASPLYAGSVRINVTTTLKAVAVINSISSAVGTAVYTIS